MEIYLNDLSFAGGNGLTADWKKVVDFADLLKKMKGVTIIAPQNVWSIPLGNYNVSTRNTNDGSTVSVERHKYLCEIFKKFKLHTSGEPLFSLNQSLTPSSSSVGMAAKLEKPIVSIILDAKFKTDEISGWLQSNNCTSESTVKNLYSETKGDSFIYLADLSKCATLDPAQNPMWNTDIAAKILYNIEFIKISDTERRSLLMKYGKIIAEINGWNFNKSLSDLNSTTDHPRFIYDSESNFTGYRTAYLSIDQEGPEVCFELCSTNGSHLGQISWDGKLKAPKGNHGIRVK